MKFSHQQGRIEILGQKSENAQMPTVNRTSKVCAVVMRSWYFLNRFLLAESPIERVKVVSAV